MSNNAERLLYPQRLYSASDVTSRPCPVPASAGVYAFYFDLPPPGVETKDCHRHGAHALLYVGIAPRPPPLNGRAPSRAHLRQRLRTLERMSSRERRMVRSSVAKYRETAP